MHYSLSKVTCGGGVGNPSLLREWIDDKPAGEVLGASLEEVLIAIPAASQIWEFLTFKHLLAVQVGIRALLGETNSGLSDGCTIESVEYGPNGVRMIALIKVDLMTAGITACGGCSSSSTDAPVHHSDSI